MVSGGWVARVLRQERRFTAKWDLLVWASLDRGRHMEVLRIVPVESTKVGRLIRLFSECGLTSS